MKKSPLKTFISLINLIFLLLVVSVVGFSFTGKKVISLITEKKMSIPVNFYIMKLSKATLERYYDGAGVKKYKRLIIQFRAIENRDSRLVEYEMKGFVMKTTGDLAGSQPIIEHYSPVRSSAIETPFALANVEFRKDDVKALYASIKDQLDKFEYLQLYPILDSNGNIAIKATAMDAGDKPLMTKFLLAPASVIFNPCPPDRPEG